LNYRIGKKNKVIRLNKIDAGKFFLCTECWDAPLYINTGIEIKGTGDEDNEILAISLGDGKHEWMQVGDFVYPTNVEYDEEDDVLVCNIITEGG